MAAAKRALHLLWEIIWPWKVRVGILIRGDNDVQEVRYYGTI